MSIEALLQAHIEAVKENTAAVLLLESTLVGRAGKAPKEEKAKGGVETADLSNKTRPFTASSTEEPKAEEPKAEEPKAEEPKAEEPKAEEPKAEEPKAEEPKAEEPKAEEPKAETLSYETARALVLKLANAGKRTEIPVVFKKHGIDNLKKLLDKEDDFTTVNDQAKLEAVYADLQALEG